MSLPGSVRLTLIEAAPLRGATTRKCCELSRLKNSMRMSDSSKGPPSTSSNCSLTFALAIDTPFRITRSGEGGENLILVLNRPCRIRMSGRGPKTLFALGDLQRLVEGDFALRVAAIRYRVLGAKQGVQPEQERGACDEDCVRSGEAGRDKRNPGVVGAVNRLLELRSGIGEKLLAAIHNDVLKLGFSDEAGDRDA